MADSNETHHQTRRHPRTVEAIAQSEEWLFTTLESIGDAVIATDARGDIIFMNAVAVALTGWNEEEAQGHDCREVFHIINEVTRLETESPVTKVLRSGVLSGLANHTLLIARDGTERSIDDSGAPIRNREGVLTGVVLIFRDITERRRTERTLNEQQEILQTLFDHIPVIIAFLAANGQFRWVNREWCRVLGWSLQEMSGRDMLAEFYPDLFRRRQVLHQWQDASAEWHDSKTTLRDGSIRDIAWATVPLSDGSSIVIGQDITSRKLVEFAQEQQSAHIEVLNRQLLQAARETHHRVKNNLQVITSLLDMQVMEHGESVPVKDLRELRLHVQTLAVIHDLLIHDLITNTRSDSLSAKATLEKLLPLLQQAVGAHRIDLSVEDIALPMKYGLTLSMLVNELVSNAVKHGSKQVELRLVAVAEKVRLEVLDNGPGFPQPFDPRAAAHVGLDLVESLSRIELKGQTSYENRPEGGACVRVTFPLPLLQQA